MNLFGPDLLSSVQSYGTIHLPKFRKTELEEAARHYVKSAPPGAHSKRRREAEAVQHRFGKIAGLARRGEMPMEAGSCRLNNGRRIWGCSVALHLVLIALDARIKRVLKAQLPGKPRLRRVVELPDVRRALNFLIDASHEVAQESGVAFVLLFDSRRHFQSLNASYAIDLFESETGATALAQTLRTVYAAIQMFGGGRGLQEGPSTSPRLAELACLHLDELVAPLGRFIRFVDNFALVVPLFPYQAKYAVYDAFEHYGALTRSAMLPHEWEVATYTDRDGFQRDRLSHTHQHGGLRGIDFLGLHLVGHERLVAKDRLGRYARERNKQGRPYAQHVLQYYGNLGVLSDKGLLHLHSVLQRAGGRGRFPHAPTGGYGRSQ